MNKDFPLKNTNPNVPTTKNNLPTIHLRIRFTNQKQRCHILTIKEVDSSQITKLTKSTRHRKMTATSWPCDELTATVRRVIELATKVKWQLAIS